MEQTAVLALLLAAVVAFLAPAPQQFLRNLLHRRPAWIFAAPPLLTAVFTIAAALSGVSSLPLALLVLAYTAAPVLCAYAQGAGPVARPSALDYLTHRDEATMNGAPKMMGGPPASSISIPMLLLAPIIS